MQYEILIVVRLKTDAFWNISSDQWKVQRRFEGLWRLLFLGQAVLLDC
jgi:hypothetical protein